MPAPALLRVVATAASVALMVSPFPDFRRVHVRQAVGDVALLPVVALHANCFMWVVYALLTHSYFPLLAVNALGVATTVGFVTVFYKWSSSAGRADARAVVVRVALALAVGVLYTVAGGHGLTFQPPAAVVATVGAVCVAVNLCLFVAPLRTTGLVLRTRSAASLPFTMCVVTFVCSSLWTALALLDGDLFVMAPNAIGAVLSGFQVALCLLYPPPKDVDVDGQLLPTKLPNTAAPGLVRVDSGRVRADSGRMYQTFTAMAQPRARLYSEEAQPTVSV